MYSFLPILAIFRSCLSFLYKFEFLLVQLLCHYCQKLYSESCDNVIELHARHLKYLMWR